MLIYEFQGVVCVVCGVCGRASTAAQFIPFWGLRQN